ncbi:MAG: ABC transporter ATP-binding protein [Actinomycetota bacterium]|nr:ABC transporter ATP-binding protein [Actinomycetota bacterium]
MTVTPPLAVRGLSRSYGDLVALRELELALDEGECVALIGHNGSGKTTAVRLIGGLLEPSGGGVEVQGVAVQGEPDSIGTRAALAVVPDTPTLYSELTAGEHLELVALAHGVAGNDLGERIDLVLGRLGLGERRDSRPGELSRGMRQKVALACALIRPYRVLVLDEPVVGLDPATQRTLRELLLEAKREGVAVLLTTHQLAFARGIADRAVLLADGEVVQDGPYEEVIEGESVYERGLL